MIPIPAEFENVLKMEYGDDYMTPIIFVDGHGYPFYKKQKKALYNALGYLPVI